MTDLTKIKCENKIFEKLNRIDYFEYEQNAELTFNSAKSIEKEINDFASAYILYYRGLQILSNALLIKKTTLKSKGKNCQFLELFKENIISLDEINKISQLVSARNDIYYMNKSNDETKYKEFIINIKEIIKLIKSKI